ncbi:MAG: hypothetical protein PVG51_10295 [Desulfosarcina sp.]|jgi:hypothetical protein
MAGEGEDRAKLARTVDPWEGCRLLNTPDHNPRVAADDTFEGLDRMGRGDMTEVLDCLPLHLVAMQLFGLVDQQ